MHIDIQNFKGIKNASLELPEGGFISITGNTGYGKTSICQAVRATCLADWKIYPSMTKAVADMLVNRLAKRDELEGKGKAVSECTIVDPAFDMSVSWSDKSVSGRGMSVSPSLPYSIGSLNICNVDSKVSSVVLSEALKLNPEKVDLIEFLPKLDEPSIASLWDDISKGGWDTTLAGRLEVGKSKKQDWKAITGEQYGVKKGANYFPNGWSPEMKTMSEAKLRDEKVEAHQRYEACLRAQGVSQERFDTLKDNADEFEGLEQQYKDLLSKKPDQSKAVSDLVNEINAIPTDNTKDAHECPSCSTKLAYVGGSIVESIAPTEEQIERRKNLQLKVDQEQEINRKLDQSIKDAKAKMDGAKKAKDELSKASLADSDSEANLAEATDALNLANDRLDAFNKKKGADKIHEDISDLAIIVTALSADGVRKKILEKKLKSFNVLLSKISTEIPISIDNELEFFIKGIPYILASGGQKQYLQGIIQIALTHIMKIPLTIIDCDRMDDFYYGQLKAIGVKAKFAVMIAGFGIKDPTHEIKNDESGMNGKLVEVNYE